MVSCPIPHETPSDISGAQPSLGGRYADHLCKTTYASSMPYRAELVSVTAELSERWRSFSIKDGGLSVLSGAGNSTEHDRSSPGAADSLRYQGSPGRPRDGGDLSEPFMISVSCIPWRRGRKLHKPRDR